MIEFFYKLFDTSGYPPRWRCGSWSNFEGWLHIVADIATGAAYFAIPLILLYFARTRRDFPFTRLFWLFAGFILACGTVHLIEATIFWYPIYRISGLMKFVTAVVSWVTVFALVQIIPKALHLPSLAATNAKLSAEIEQRRTTEQDLRQLKARYEALISGTRSIVWTTNPEGLVVDPMPSWERYTGHGWDKHQGYGWTNSLHEEDRERVKEIWLKALENGTRYTAQGRIWHEASGTYRTFIAEGVPVKDEDGNIVEWVGTTDDIHDQRLAEAALDIAQADLLRQKRELELIYNSAPVGMSLVDREGKFVRVNSRLAEIHGVTADQHIDKTIPEIVPELKDQLLPLYEELFHAGEPLLDRILTGKTAASSEARTWLASFYPLKGEDGNFIAVNSIVQDITEQKTLEAALRESEQRAMQANLAKSEFLANMSHEIRTPMAAILGYADVLLGHLKDPDNRSCVHIMKRNGEHLLELINDILDLSRIEAGKLDVELHSCPITTLVGDIISLMRVRAEEKELDLEVEFVGKVPEQIQTDATRLRQVLINLIGNAIKFTDTGKVTLIVQLIKVGIPQIEFAVRDTGIGLTEEQQLRLFKPFSQGDSSVTRSYGGSGLGLAISKRLVHMLGGEMGVHSQFGKGATFFVRLPIDSIESVNLVEPDLISRASLSEPHRKNRKLNCRVLVVDDRRDVRHISQHFLEKAGAVVATAEDGEEGVQAARQAMADGNPFDLIVMDMQMPKVDGLQATLELRSSGIEWPIIALTADAMKGDRERCLNGGCDDYLAKPIDHGELVEMVGRYTQDISLADLRERRKQRLASLRSELHHREREQNGDAKKKDSE